MNIGSKGRNALHFKGFCEEASMHSREKYIPCGAPANSAVYLKGDDATYAMCPACANHNTRNRGGELLAEGPHTEIAKPAPAKATISEKYLVNISSCGTARRNWPNATTRK
jgi:hypothetical protein